MNVEDRLEKINMRGRELDSKYWDQAVEEGETHDYETFERALELACRGQATLEFRVGDLELEIAELKERMI